VRIVFYVQDQGVKVIDWQQVDIPLSMENFKDQQSLDVCIASGARIGRYIHAALRASAIQGVKSLDELPDMSIVEGKKEGSTGERSTSLICG
jgi:hypothetical protein